MPYCAWFGSGRSRDPTNCCANTAGADSDATTKRNRPRVTHLHINPTLQPRRCPYMLERNVACRRRSTFVLMEFILTEVISSNISTSPSLETVREAARRIQPYIHRTPLLASQSLSERIGVEVR